MSVNTVHAMIYDRAELYYNKTAFTERGGGARSFGELMIDAHLAAGELDRLGLAGRPAAVTGQVDYATLAAMLGCLEAGCPLVPLDQGLGADKLCELITGCEIGTLLCGPGSVDIAVQAGQKLPGLKVVENVGEELIKSDVPAWNGLPPVDPAGPAFLFFNEDGAGAMLSHKNICAAIEAISSVRAVGSYTFLAPAVWGGAFDCIMGLLLPLWSGCGLIRRGEKRGRARTIAESGASALTCTSPRLRGLERSLWLRSEKKRGPLAASLARLTERLGGRAGAGKAMGRRVRSLIGGDLKFILCGGVWPDRESARLFSGWGIEVCSCYFTPECGPLAVFDPSFKKLVPLTDITVPSPVKDDFGELCVAGDRAPIGYFGGRTDFGEAFPTGDMGRITEDGALELRGRKKTALYGRDGELVFPEEMAEVILASRYVADCSITGRFDTKTADVLITAHITPDFKEVNTVLGEKYSPNRLRLFFNTVMERMAPSLPHRIHEFTLPD